MNRLTSATLALSLFLALFLTLGATTGNATDGDVEVGANGLHTQPWFIDSFLDLKEDLVEAASEGKGLAIFIEQEGCPYCRELHRVNLANPEIASYIQENFVALQLDLRGSREVTDFDGEVMEERKLTRRWGAVFTPTIVLFHPSASEAEGAPGNRLAAATLPGYFKPFHFRTMLEYVAQGHYANKHFQDYINERAARLRAEGKDVSVW